MSKTSTIACSLICALAVSACETPAPKPGAGAPEVVSVPGPRLPAIPPEVLDTSREESFLDRLKSFFSPKPAAPISK